MSFHNKLEWKTPKLEKALQDHYLPTDKPSQLADAFRCGWFAARRTESAGGMSEGARDGVSLVWDANGKFFQNWTWDCSGSGRAEAEDVADKLGGTVMHIDPSQSHEDDVRVQKHHVTVFWRLGSSTALGRLTSITAKFLKTETRHGRIF